MNYWKSTHRRDKQDNDSQPHTSLQTGALRNPKGIYRQWKNPKGVTKPVIGIDSSSHLTWWYALAMSNFVRYWAFPTLSKRLSIRTPSHFLRGSGKGSGSVTEFNFRKSVHNLRPPSAFLTATMGAAQVVSLGASSTIPCSFSVAKTIWSWSTQGSTQGQLNVVLHEMGLTWLLWDFLKLRDQTHEFTTLRSRQLRFTGRQHIRLNRVSSTDKIRHSRINRWTQTSITYIILF